MGFLSFTKPKEVECKRILGQTVCKVQAMNTVTVFPTAKKNGIPLNFYTSKQCPEAMCGTTFKALTKMNAELNNIFHIRSIQADTVRTPREVLMLPTIMIGNQVIVGKDFDKISLLEATSRHFTQQL